MHLFLSRSLSAVTLGMLLVALAGCDPEMNMHSTADETKRSIEECPEAVDKVRQCCPQYESYLSCTVIETWTGQESADFSEKQSHCLRSTECGAVEKAITGGGQVCGVSFRGHKCR